MYWNDELFAALNGIPKVTYKNNKSLPFEAKLRLPAVEVIAALYLSRRKENAKCKRGTKK
jgi:hypothetical protein